MRNLLSSVVAGLPRRSRFLAPVGMTVLMVISSNAQAWQAQQSNTTAGLRGISAVSSKVAWASGTGGTFLRTVDGGDHWQASIVSGAEQLDFRDIEAWDEKTAVLLSIGNAEKSRLYKTTDGGEHWRLLMQNSDPKGFWDCMAWWDRKNGIMVGDPVDQKFQIFVTKDSGEHWQQHSAPALPGEGAFAASGTCVAAWMQSSLHRHPARVAALGTGGAAVARILQSADGGATWTITNTEIISGSASAGIFSVAPRYGFDDPACCFVVGGRYDQPKNAERNAGRPGYRESIELSHGPLPHGFRSGVATTGLLIVTVGTNGSDFSMDGDSWQPIDNENYNSVSFAPDGSGWAVGPKGRIAKWIQKP